MKTFTIKTPTAELLIIELPETGSTFDVLMEVNSETEGYSLLGKPDEIKEEDAKEFVQDINVGSSVRYVPDVKFYNSVCRVYFDTAKEALFLLLASEIFWKNPHGEIYPKLSDDLNRWIEDVERKRAYIEAEQKTFDRNRSLIFKKNK